MLRSQVLEQLPGMALMEVRAKLQTPDIVSRTEVQHKLITLCWGCNQIVCNACCMALCMSCPLYGGKHTAFLQRSWALQLAERPMGAPANINSESSLPKCPSCHRLMCVLCDLGICPGCLKPPKDAGPDTADPPIDCASCGRRLCAGCGRCECRRCQPELCRLCVRVRPRRCHAQCNGSAITLRSKELPPLPAEEADKNDAKKGAKSTAPISRDTVRCPACDRRCSASLLAAFCCRGKWTPQVGCSHNTKPEGAAGGGKGTGKGERRLEMAACISESDGGDSCDSEESSEPVGYAELVPPHCRIFTAQCRADFQ